MKQIKQSMRKRLTTVMNDRKLGKVIKKKKNELLKSILSEAGGILVLHSVDQNEQKLEHILELQTKLLDRAKPEATLSAKLDLFMKTMQQKMGRIEDSVETIRLQINKEEETKM